LKQLFDSVIQLLIKSAQKPKTVIGFASVECLKEIGNTTPVSDIIILLIASNLNQNSTF
jgi:hypothetical protein